MPTGFAIVTGYLEGDELPAVFAATELSSRCAVLLPNPDSVDASFDRELYIDVLSLASHAASADTARIGLDDGTLQQATTVEQLEKLFNSQPAPPEPFPIVAFFAKAKLVAALISEPYARVGGPAPYHDTYTQSLYALPATIARFTQHAQTNFGARLNQRFDGATSPSQRPFAAPRALWTLMTANRSDRQRARLLDRVLSNTMSHASR